MRVGPQAGSCWSANIALRTARAMQGGKHLDVLWAAPRCHLTLKTADLVHIDVAEDVVEVGGILDEAVPEVAHAVVEHCDRFFLHGSRRHCHHTLLHAFNRQHHPGCNGAYKLACPQALPGTDLASCSDSGKHVCSPPHLPDTAACTMERPATNAHGSAASPIHLHVPFPSGEPKQKHMHRRPVGQGGKEENRVRKERQGAKEERRTRKIGSLTNDERASSMDQASSDTVIALVFVSLTGP
jgi:hypothetical protein